MTDLPIKVKMRSSRKVGAGSQVRPASTTLIYKEERDAMSIKFSPALSDVELVALWQSRGSKDDRPFHELFRRHQKTVWRICYGYIRNAQDAEDLTQDVFLKAYRNLDAFEGRSSFKTWISRIAINSCKNETRRRSRRPQLSETDVDTMAEVLPSLETTESEWTTRRQYELLNSAMGELQPEALEILVLKDLEQRPYAEIAELLGISVSAAKMRAQRARIALQRLYNNLESEGTGL